MARIFRNKIYATNPTPVLHRHVSTVVRFEEEINRWRHVPTGRIVSAGRARTLAGLNGYWNSVRAIARAGEFRSIGEARNLFGTFTDIFEGLDQEELSSVRHDVFGSP